MKSIADLVNEKRVKFSDKKLYILQIFDRNNKQIN